MINKIVSAVAKMLNKSANEAAKSEFTLTFQKEVDGCWYIVHPEWKGPHHNLMMVRGADLFLDYFHDKYVKETKSQDATILKEVQLNVTASEEEIPDLEGNCIKFVNTGDVRYGATYKTHNADEFTNNIWLCPVTLFVVGRYPKFFYVQKNKR